MDMIHFFRAGKHTSANGQTITFSDADLRQVAQVYNPSKHEAPLVVGHPSKEAPAYGWVSGIVAKDDGLYAQTRDVSPEFAEQVKIGAYKKVSGSFYKPDAPGNPTPGKWHLRHIGFLGAQPPAVKGLRPIEFAADTSNVLDFEEGTFDLREYRIEQAELRIQRREVRHDLEKLAAEAKIHFPDIEPLASFLEGLDDSETVEFSELDDDDNKRMKQVPQREWFLGFLKRRLPFLYLGEFATGELPEETAQFSAPEGYTVASEGVELRSQALAYAKQHQCSFADAIRALNKNRV